MKLDKETLLKNRFWVALVAFLPIFLGLMIVTWLTAGEPVKANKAAIDTANGALKPLTDIKTDKQTQLLVEKAKELREKKDKVWAEAWRGQANLMVWPRSVPDTLRRYLEDEATFGAPIDPNDCRTFGQKGGWY